MKNKKVVYLSGKSFYCFFFFICASGALMRETKFQQSQLYGTKDLFKNMLRVLF